MNYEWILFYQFLKQIKLLRWHDQREYKNYQVYILLFAKIYWINYGCNICVFLWSVKNYIMLNCVYLIFICLHYITSIFRRISPVCTVYLNLVLSQRQKECQKKIKVYYLKANINILILSEYNCILLGGRVYCSAFQHQLWCLSQKTHMHYPVQLEFISIMYITF